MRNLLIVLQRMTLRRREKGHIFKCSDETGPTSILVDGIIASMLYAFDINADKKIINETLSRTRLSTCRTKMRKYRRREMRKLF